MIEVSQRCRKVAHTTALASSADRPNRKSNAPQLTLASSRAPQANLVRALGARDRSTMRLSVDFRPPVERRGLIAVADDAPFVVCVSAPAFGSGHESVATA
jgi:hypothetical protein